MSDKFSIITVNYNNKDGLQKTIDSVINQTFKNFEFIIVDGGSSDGSKDIIAKEAAYFTHWLSEPDHGIYHAMNKGIKMATGDYLLFLNSADCLIDNDVLNKIDLEIDNSFDIYYGDILFKRANGTRKIVFPEHLTFDFFFTDNLSHQATFIKRSLFDKIFMYNESFKIVSDWEFLVYAICKMNASYKHLDLLITLYNGNGISSKSDNYKIVYQERDISLSRHFPAFKDDYAKISQLKQKRVKQFLVIKAYPISWKILKVFIKLIYFLLPQRLKN